MEGLLVVGGVKTDGTQSDYAKTAPFVQVNAPSERICVANPKFEEPKAVRYTFGTGTSEGMFTHWAHRYLLDQEPQDVKF